MLYSSSCIGCRWSWPCSWGGGPCWPAYNPGPATWAGHPCCWSPHSRTPPVAPSTKTVSNLSLLTWFFSPINSCLYAGMKNIGTPSGESVALNIVLIIGIEPGRLACKLAFRVHELLNMMNPWNGTFFVTPSFYGLLFQPVTIPTLKFRIYYEFWRSDVCHADVCQCVSSCRHGLVWIMVSRLIVVAALRHVATVDAVGLPFPAEWAPYPTEDGGALPHGHAGPSPSAHSRRRQCAGGDIISATRNLRTAISSQPANHKPAELSPFKTKKITAGINLIARRITGGDQDHLTNHMQHQQLLCPSHRPAFHSRPSPSAPL